MRTKRMWWGRGKENETMHRLFSPVVAHQSSATDEHRVHSRVRVVADAVGACHHVVSGQQRATAQVCALGMVHGVRETTKRYLHKGKGRGVNREGTKECFKTTRVLL